MAPRIGVIGAGHHGLVAAIRLAAAGCDVVVLEAADRPGGGVQSRELTLPGFWHDPCAGFFPLAAASPVFRELELEVDWINPPVAMAHVLDEDGGAIALHRDLEATAESLERVARGAGNAWSELVRSLWPYRRALIGALLGPLPALRAAGRLITGLRSKALELAPLALASSASGGSRLFADERATAWLAGTGAHADLSPQAPGSGVFALGLNFLGHDVGWPFPVGGARRLTEALVGRLEQLGGEVRCDSPVARIELSGRRVAALRLADDDRIAVDAALCTVSPHSLLALLPRGSLPGRVERRLQQWRYGMGTFKLDCALSAPVPWRSADASRAGVVHVGGSLAESVTSLTQAGLGRFPDAPALVVGQQTLHDPTRAPEGKHTLYAYARVPSRTNALSPGEMCERIELQIERFAPGFRRVIEARSIRTPEAIEAENPSMGNGDLASGSCELDQQLIFRPDPMLVRGRTPLAGLYVAGGWVHPGPGVHGISGRFCADALLRDRRWRKWR
jgi:phytoene dehydrogenase-like protein